MNIVTNVSVPVALRLRMLVAYAVAVASGDMEHGRSSERKFNEIFRANNNLIAGICLSFAGTREEFEDLRQDSLLNIWNGIDSFRGDSNASTWVYRVVLNTCVSYKRRWNVDKRDAQACMEFYRDLFCESSPEECERYELMYRLISALPPMDKSILLMWLDDKRYEEIAEVVGLSRDAVASRLKRAKDRLALMASSLTHEGL